MDEAQEQDEPRIGLKPIGEGLRASLERMAKLRETVANAKEPEPSKGQVVQFQGKLSRLRKTITARELAQQLTRLDVVYPSQPRDEAMMALRYQTYFDVLKHLELSDLQLACNRYLRSGEKFGPTPGQLLELAKI